MPCPRCNETPCACPPPTLLDLLRIEDVGPNILSSISSNELSGLLGASHTTRDIARDHVIGRVGLGRWHILRLFQDDGPLYERYLCANRALHSDIELFSSPYDNSKPREATRAGQYLAHIAVAILNTCNDMCYARFKDVAKGWEYGVVVVTTIVVHEGRYILIVALNGGSPRFREVYEKYCTSTLSALALGLHEIRVVHNSDSPHVELVKFVENHVIDSKQAVRKWVKNAKGEKGQDWHGEQKLLQYVGDTFGFDAKKFLLCLGISHLAGPCNDQTTRTQHCERFLHALRKLDQSFLGKDAGYLMGFWFEGGTKERWENPIYKVSLNDFRLSTRN